MSISMAGVEDPPDPAAVWQGLQGRAAELTARTEARKDLARRLEANLEVKRASLDGMRRQVELLQGRLEDAVVGKRRASSAEGTSCRRGSSTCCRSPWPSPPPTGNCRKPRRSYLATGDGLGICGSCSGRGSSV